MDNLYTIACTRSQFDSVTDYVYSHANVSLRCVYVDPVGMGVLYCLISCSHRDYTWISLLV